MGGDERLNQAVPVGFQVLSRGGQWGDALEDRKGALRFGRAVLVHEYPASAIQDLWLVGPSAAALEPDGLAQDAGQLRCRRLRRGLFDQRPDAVSRHVGDLPPPEVTSELAIEPRGLGQLSRCREPIGLFQLIRSQEVGVDRVREPDRQGGAKDLQSDQHEH